MADDVQVVSGDGITLTDAGPMIVATVALADCGRERALAAFTDPAVLARWWRGELAADLVPGGRYVVSFAAIGARLTGAVRRYDPAAGVLEFSWSWDDQPPDSTVTVRVSAGPAGGSLLTIEHGPHSTDEAGRSAHQEHWDGWQFFLPRLPAAVAD